MAQMFRVEMRANYPVLDEGYNGAMDRLEAADSERADAEIAVNRNSDQVSRMRADRDGRMADEPSADPSPRPVYGLPPGEGAFLACTFWLADNYSLMGRTEEATEVFERLLSLRNDLGLLAEEYDPRAERLVGNFPQAFSHVPLINTARNLSTRGGPSHQREKTTEAGQRSVQER